MSARCAVAHVSTAMLIALVLPSRAFAQAGFGCGRHHEARRLPVPIRQRAAFDAAGLVPHFFVQHYEVTEPWLVVRARYPVGGRAGETTIGFAPQRPGHASHFDTFFQSDSDLVTSGTTGDVRLSGFAIDQGFAIARARAAGDRARRPLHETPSSFQRFAS